MSYVIATPASRAPAARDRDAGHADHDREPTRTWGLVMALANAGAAMNPAAALAARHLARIRDEELRRGRR